MTGDESTLTLLELFYMGGIFMWPLLAFSIATTALALERTIYLLAPDLRLGAITEKLLPFARGRDKAGGAAYLATVPHRCMGARVLAALVDRWDLSEHLQEKAAETEALVCISALDRGLNFLVALGSLSPLTGFLGTVSGMIGAFKSIAEATEVNAQIVASGIYEALITTVFGLIIAIVAMIFHSLLSSRVDKFTQDVEVACTELITQVASMPPPVPPAAPEKSGVKGFWAR
jgi:biopolymer transport protein ExbB